MSRVWVVGVLLLVLAPLGVRAQEGHGWFVVEAPEKAGEKPAATPSASKATIVHLPPPDRMIPRGSVRVVQGLTRAPERLAWSGSTLYFMMPPERVGENEEARRVYTISTVPGLMSGWDYVPADRPEMLPTLAGKWGARDLEVAGMAAAPGTPIVMMERQDRVHALLMLSATEWVEAGLPWHERGGTVVEPPRASDRCRLITTADSYGILIERGEGGAGEWCVASLPGVIPAGGEPVPVAYTVRSVKVERPGALRDVVYCVEEQLVRLTHDGDGVRLSVLRASDEYAVTTLAGLGADLRVAPVEGNPGFLALLCRAPAEEGAAPASASRKDPGYRMLEVTPSGRVLYDGPARQGGPVSVREVQMLAVLLVMVMAAVVVFVLRPDNRVATGQIALPRGFLPAESGRRVVATILDVGLGWVVASLIMRLDMSDMARPDLLLATPRGWQVIGIALGLTVVMGMVMEWQFGRTIGKLMLGCRVLMVEERGKQAPEATGSGGGGESAVRGAIAREGVSARAALARNLMKWTPWNVVEFLATGRHRPWADRVSGTLVVVFDGTDEDSAG